MNNPTSPLMGLPVLDVPHPQRVVGTPEAVRRREEEPAGPPNVTLPSAKKTIVGSASDEIAFSPKIPLAAVAPVAPVAPVASVALVSKRPAYPSAQKTILGTGFDLEALAKPGADSESVSLSELRPTIPETPSSMRPPPPAQALEPTQAPRMVRVTEPDLEVPTTSTSPALWLLVVAICAVIAGVIYTL